MMCTKEENGNYSLTGLALSDVEEIEEGLILLFNRAYKGDNKYKGILLKIHASIDEVLRKEYADKDMQGEFHF